MNDLPALLAQCKQLIDSKQADRAVGYLTNAVVLWPDTAEAYNLLGIAYCANGQAVKAIPTIERALELNPRSAEIHFNLAAALELVGALDRANDSYQQASLIRPDWAELHLRWGNVLRAIHRPQEALDAYRRASTYRSDYVAAFNGAGTIQLSRGDLEGALWEFHQALLAEPRNVEALRNRNIVLEKWYQLSPPQHAVSSDDKSYHPWHGNNTPSERRFLVYFPAENTKIRGEFFGPHRLFDVAINDHTGSGKGLEQADYLFTERGYKFPCIIKNLPRITRPYDYYAFFDDDIEISTSELNRLFLIGEMFSLNLFQASLGPKSYFAHPTLLMRPNSYVRPVKFVEVMMPVFSAKALACCQPSFGESESGYGQDWLWPKLLRYERIAVIDAIVAEHTRPVRSHHWRSSKGVSAMDELRQLLKRHNLDPRVM